MFMFMFARRSLTQYTLRASPNWFYSLNELHQLILSTVCVVFVRQFTKLKCLRYIFNGVREEEKKKNISAEKPTWEFENEKKTQKNLCT